MLHEVKVYLMDAMSSNSMKSSNPYSGIHEAEVTKCLDTMCLDPACNQGGCMVVYSVSCKQQSLATQKDIAATVGANDFKEPQSIVYALEGNGARPSHLGKGFSDDGTMYTLNTIEQHSVCYPKCYQQTVGALCADDWRMINKQYVDQNKVVCYENVQR